MSDPNAENRKADHISLAFKSQVQAIEKDNRFYYEPMLAAHPQGNILATKFLGKQMQAPIWVGSMTGGTALAGKINRNLAEVCAEFGLGMGLGSCRSLLESNQFFEDFNMKSIIGDALPFYANLGVAQVELLLQEGKSDLIQNLIHSLKADGLIMHVNPLQEWLQPEGDRFKKPPVETIVELLDILEYPLIIKEVGQGFGPASIKALLQLPLAAIEFGALGGTNFSKLELLRTSSAHAKIYEMLIKVGHTAEEMVEFINTASMQLGDKVKCSEIIVSGGVTGFLDGYYCLEKLQFNAVYAQASAFLKYAKEDIVLLREYVKTQVDGLALCKNYLTVRT